MTSLHGPPQTSASKAGVVVLLIAPNGTPLKSFFLARGRVVVPISQVSLPRTWGPSRQMKTSKETPAAYRSGDFKKRAFNQRTYSGRPAKKPVPPSDLFSFLIRPPGLGDWHFIGAPFAFANFGGDFWLKPKAVGFQ